MSEYHTSFVANVGGTRGLFRRRTHTARRDNIRFPRVHASRAVLRYRVAWMSAGEREMRARRTRDRDTRTVNRWVGRVVRISARGHSRVCPPPLSWRRWLAPSGRWTPCVSSASLWQPWRNASRGAAGGSPRPSPPRHPRRRRSAWPLQAPVQDPAPASQPQPHRAAHHPPSAPSARFSPHFSTFFLSFSQSSQKKTNVPSPHDDRAPCVPCVPRCRERHSPLACV